MRDWIRNIRNFSRRVKNRLADGRDLAIGGRWLALCLLIAGVAAVGVWGSSGEEGGVNGVLQVAWHEQNSALPKVVIDDFPQEDEKNTALSEEEQADKDVDLDENVDVDVEDGDVIDSAPEPWVGDAVLQAEADLLALTPPLSDFNATPMRSFGYGYDESFGDYRFHNGVDWQAEEGAAVLAAVDGKVAALTQDAVYGDGVVLKCGEKLELTYYGLKPAADLTVEKAVKAGDTLGQIAPAPLFEDSYPPHLHLEIRLDGEVVDPSEYTAQYQQG